MARLQAVAIGAITLLISGGLWLHEHDVRVKFQALAEHRADSLAIDAKQIDGFVAVLHNINLVYQEHTKEYERRYNVLNDSLHRYQGRIDNLVDQIEKNLPDSSKHLASEVATACRQQVNVIQTLLNTCDSLRNQANVQIAKQADIIFKLQDSRDGYKKLFEDVSKEKNPSKVWPTIGKVTTGGTIVGIVGRLLKFW